MNDLWYIPPSDFLSRMSARDRATLLEAGTRRQFKKHDFIFQAGSPGENVYALIDGRVKIYQLSGLGRETILWFCFPGEVFGLAEIPRGGRREVYAQACSDSTIVAIGKERFQRFLADTPPVAMLVIDLLSCRLRALGEMLMNLSSDDATSRVIKLLIRLWARYGSEMEGDIYLNITLTHQEMADMIGTSRQTVTTVLNQLRRKNVLAVENHRIHILRPDLLQAMIQEGPQMMPVALGGHCASAR